MWTHVWAMEIRLTLLILVMWYISTSYHMGSDISNFLSNNCCLVAWNSATHTDCYSPADKVNAIDRTTFENIITVLCWWLFPCSINWKSLANLSIIMSTVKSWSGTLTEGRRQFNVHFFVMSWWWRRVIFQWTTCHFCW